MQINVSYDQSIGSLPAGFFAAINYVVTLYDSLFTNPVTINIDVGYGEIAGQTLGSSALGESESYLVSPSYAQTVAALRGAATSTLQTSADATLPATAPYSSGNLWMTTAEAKAVGLLSGSGTSLDGYVGFSSTLPFSYSTTGAPASGQYDFVAVAEHEISEVMGRISLLGANVNGATSYGVMDLFRYSAPGVRDLTATPPSPYSGAYFSVNGGTTNLDNWNTSTGGDLGDWAASAGNDAFLAFSPSGQRNGLSSADLALMNVLGWDLPPPPTVTSVAASPASGTLSAGDRVTFTLGLSAAASVSGAGTPDLQLNDGGVATYDAAATAALNDPTKLVFDYTVASSDRTLEGLAVTGVQLNGASVQDVAGDSPNWAGLFRDFQGLNVSASTPADPVTSRDGTEILVNTITAGNQLSPKSAALAGGGFVTTWTDTSGAFGVGGGSVIAGQLFDANGNKVGSEFLVDSVTAGYQDEQSVAALAGGGFVVAWQDGSSAIGDANGTGIAAQIFAGNGNAAGSEFLVSPPAAANEAWPSVAGLADGGFVVTWDDQNDNPGDGLHSVKGQIFGATGTAVVSEFVVGSPATGWEGQSAVAGLQGGDFVVAWEVRDGSGPSGYSIQVQLYGASGNKVGVQVGVASDTVGLTAHPAVTALESGGYVVSWMGLSGGEAQLFGASGNTVGSVIAITGPTPPQSGQLTVSGLANGGFVATWTDYSNTLGDTNWCGIAAQVFDASGNKVGSPFLVNAQTAGPQWQPSVAGLSDGGFAVSWSDQSNRIGDPSGTAVAAQIYNTTPATTTIASGAMLEINAASAAQVAFGLGTGTLQLDHSAAFTGAVLGFTGSDAIDLRDVAFGSNTQLGYGANAADSGGTLTVTDGTHTAALSLLGQYAAGMFSLSSDGQGGTTVLDPPIASPLSLAAAPA